MVGRGKGRCIVRVKKNPLNTNNVPVGTVVSRPSSR
jgi:hypothetical protein